MTDDDPYYSWLKKKVSLAKTDDEMNTWMLRIITYINWSIGKIAQDNLKGAWKRL